MDRLRIQSADIMVQNYSAQEIGSKLAACCYQKSEMNRLSENASASGGAGVCREARVDMRIACQELVDDPFDIGIE